MALNFNLLNAEAPGQIATSAMRGYESAQNRATELAQQKQQNQLNALKISEAQRTEQSQNALSRAYSESVDPVTGGTDYNKLTGLLATGGAGKEIPGIQKARSEQQTAQLAQQKAKIELVDAKIKQSRNFLDTLDPNDPNAGALYMQWHERNHSDPILGPELAAQGITAEQQRAQIERAIAQGPEALAKLINISKLGSEKVMEMNKTPEIQTMRMLGYPITKEGFEAYRAAQRPDTLSLEDRIRIAEAGRSPGSTVKINTQLSASEQAQKQFMDEARDTFTALKQAPIVLSNIEAAKKLIPQAKGFMGPGGEPLLAAASFLNNRLGTNIDTKGVESAEELRSRLFFGILDNLKKLDSQPTQQQQDALRVALGSIGTDPTALPRVLDAFGNSIREKVDLYNQEVTDAEERGVRFPYKPTITLKPTTAGKDAAAVVGAYTDAAKEARYQRYQQWLKTQGR